MNQTKLLYYAAIGWTIAIFIGCSIPGDGLPHAFTSRDKVMHIGIFLLFGFLWRQLGRTIWWVLMAGAAYGMLIEIWQGVMPINRSFDLYDALADTVGTLLGIGLAEVVSRVVRKNQ
jgi:VanZ family protein